MAEFSKELIEKAWERSGGVCECRRAGHGHIGRCHNSLIKGHRDDRISYFGWQAYSKSGDYLDSLDDCEILCYDPCYKAAMNMK